MSERFKKAFKQLCGDTRRKPSEKDIGKRVKLTYLSATTGESYKIVTGILKHTDGESVDLDDVEFNGKRLDFFADYIIPRLGWQCVYEVTEDLT